MYMDFVEKGFWGSPKIKYSYYNLYKSNEETIICRR